MIAFGNEIWPTRHYQRVGLFRPFSSLNQFLSIDLAR